MKKLIGLILAVAILVAIGKVALFSAPRSPEILKIGVVNMTEVFDKIKKRALYEELIKKAEDDEMRQLKTIDDKIKELQKKLETVKPDSEVWNAFAGEIDVWKLQRDQQFKTARKRLTKKYNDQMSELYKEMRSEIDKFAAKNDFSLILKTDPPQIRNEENQEEMAQLGISIRTVLYYEKAMDITETIIKILNGEQK